MNKQRKYTPGNEDVERVLDRVDKEYKEARKKAWLEEHYGKKRPKGGDNVEDQEKKTPKEVEPEEFDGAEPEEGEEEETK